jgi:hypothetical protein
MNAQVDFNKILDAAAMANILYSEKEIEAMCYGTQPMVQKVADIVRKVASGDVIHSADCVPIGKPARKKETNPRATGFSYEQQKQLITLALQNTHMEVDQMAVVLKMKEATLRNWLIRMDVDGVVRKQNLCGRAVLWFLPDYTHPFIAEYKESHERREVAMRLQKPYYEAFKCVRCGLTKRMTVRNRCLGCTQGQSLDYYYSIKTD